MGFDYGRMQGTATRLMQRFKQGVVTLTRVTAGTPDPATPWIPGTATTTTYELDAITKSVEDKFVDGTTILATDTQIKTGALMTRTHINAAPAAAETVETLIAPGDVVAIDGHAVTVVREMRFPKAGPVVMWTLIVRG
jgi:hypothetical protein